MEEKRSTLFLCVVFHSCTQQWALEAMLDFTLPEFIATHFRRQTSIYDHEIVSHSTGTIKRYHNFTNTTLSRYILKYNIVYKVLKMHSVHIKQNILCNYKPYKTNSTRLLQFLQVVLHNYPETKFLYNAQYRDGHCVLFFRNKYVLGYHYLVMTIAQITFPAAFILPPSCMVTCAPYLPSHHRYNDLRQVQSYEMYFLHIYIVALADTEIILHIVLTTLQPP